MPADNGRNEGFRLLEDFVCETIALPEASDANRFDVKLSRGANQGQWMLPEIVENAIPTAEDDPR
jgi:hypothetical protein